jgi:hypothetical protein
MRCYGADWEHGYGVARKAAFQSGVFNLEASGEGGYGIGTSAMCNTLSSLAPAALSIYHESSASSANG